LATPQRRTVI